MGAKSFGGDDGRETGVLHDEGILVAARHIGQNSVPEAVGIVAIEGEHLAKLLVVVQFWPPRSGVEGCVETLFCCHIFQRHVVAPRSSAFVLNLHAHDGTAIFPLQALHLLEDVAVEIACGSQETCCRGAQFILLRIALCLVSQPYGEPSLIDLAMTERSDAQHHRHLLLLTDFNEASQVLVAFPIPMPLFLLMVNPEDISGKDGDATCPHLLNLTSPFPFGHTGIVNLAHHGQHMLSVDDETT